MRHISIEKVDKIVDNKRECDAFVGCLRRGLKSVINRFNHINN